MGIADPGFNPNPADVSGAEVMGGIIGLAIGAVVHRVRQFGLDEEQRAVHDEICRLQAWSPFFGVKLLAMWLLLSGGAAWVALRA